jgi:hypothetical protein
MTSTYYKYGLLPKDLEKEKKKQRALIQLEIEQNMKDLERVKESKANQGELMKDSKFDRPLSERLKDRNTQRRNAFTLLMTILNDAQEAQTAIENLTDEEIFNLNRYGPSLRNDIADQFADIDADFFVKYFRNYTTQQKSSDNLLRYHTKWDAKELESADDYLGNFSKMFGASDLPPYKGKYSRKTITDLINKYTNDFMDQPAEVQIKHQEKVESLMARIVKDIQKLSKKAGKPNAEDQQKQVELKLFLDELLAYKDQYLHSVRPTAESFMSGLELAEERSRQEEEEMEPAIAPFGMATEPAIPPFEMATEALFANEEGDVGFGIMGRMGRMGLKKGSGAFMMKKNKRPIFGRGLAIEQPTEESRYVPFGKFIMDSYYLENNKLVMKYPSKGPLRVEELRRKRDISPSFSKFILDFVEKKRISKPRFQKLSDEEKQLFALMLEASDLQKHFKIGKGMINSDEMDEDMKKYQVVLGQIRMGNTNPDLKRQLIMLLSKFVTQGRIDQMEGEDILKDLIK